jgi:hypothetical protein
MLIIINCGSSEPPRNDLAPPLALEISSDAVITFWGENNEEYFVGYNVYEVKESTVLTEVEAETYLKGKDYEIIKNMVVNMYPSDDTSLDEDDEEEIKKIYTAYHILNGYRAEGNKGALIEPDVANGNIPKDSRLKPASGGLSLPTFRETRTMNEATQIAFNAISMITSGNYVALTSYSLIENIDSSLSEVKKVPTD